VPYGIWSEEIVLKLGLYGTAREAIVFIFCRVVLLECFNSFRCEYTMLEETLLEVRQ
jgi:hypothetical protein